MHRTWSQNMVQRNTRSDAEHVTAFDLHSDCSSSASS
jgi:hypothetical protein